MSDRLQNEIRFFCNRSMRYTGYSSQFLEKEQLASLSNNRQASELLPMGNLGETPIITGRALAQPT
jgi:hypothetical protein